MAKKKKEVIVAESVDLLMGTIDPPLVEVLPQDSLAFKLLQRIVADGNGYWHTNLDGVRYVLEVIDGRLKIHETKEV